MTAALTKDQIISNLYNSKNFNDCIRKMEPVHLQDDLRCEVLAVVCEWPEEKVIQLHKDQALEFYVVRVILNQVKSKTSPFVRTYRKTFVPYDGQSRSTMSISDDYKDVAFDNISSSAMDRAAANLDLKLNNNDSNDLREREIKESLEQIAMAEIDKLYWYDAEMIRLYMKHGNFRAIEKETGIPFISCYKNIKKSLATLRKIAIQKAEPLFSKEELQFIQNNKPCRDT